MSITTTLTPFPDTMLVDLAANEAIFPLDWRQTAASIMVTRVNAGDSQLSNCIIHRAAENVGFSQLMTAAGFTFPVYFPVCWGTGTCTGSQPSGF